MIRVNSVHPTTVNTPMIMNDAIYKLFRPDLENPQAEDMGAAFVGYNALRYHGWSPSTSATRCCGSPRMNPVMSPG